MHYRHMRLPGGAIHTRFCMIAAAGRMCVNKVFTLLNCTQASTACIWSWHRLACLIMKSLHDKNECIFTAAKLYSACSSRDCCRRSPLPQ